MAVMAALVCAAAVARADEEGEGRLPLPLIKADLSQPLPPAEPERVPRTMHRWVWDHLTAGRVNPLGASTRFRTGYRGQLTDLAGPLFDESYVALKLHTEITPAYSTVGARFELMPLTILQLAAQYELIGSYGTFFNTMSFPSIASDYRDSELRRTRDTAYSTTGDILSLEALFQVKVDAIALRNQFRAASQRMSLAAGDRFFYHSALDVLFPNAGWAVVNDLDLLWLFPFGLKLGARHTVTRVFYGDAPDPSDVKDTLTPTHRVGLAVAYSFFERRKDEGARWNAPTLALLAQWWVRHPYRTGADSSVGLPYLVLAFAHRGDFLP
jgi:hypothetical protein